jgi:hypothetical protein
MKRFAFGNIREFDRAKAEESRTVEFIISSADRDRHRTVLNMKGWELENFNLNPIVGYQHNVYGHNLCYPDNPDNVLGPGRAWLEDDKLIGAVTFETKEINPLAEKIFQKVLKAINDMEVRTKPTISQVRSFLSSPLSTSPPTQRL